VNRSCEKARNDRRVLVKALKRLAVTDEMAGVGDVADLEGGFRISFARRALADIGVSWKNQSDSEEVSDADGSDPPH
jgi:hypothetical protein